MFASHLFLPNEIFSFNRIHLLFWLFKLKYSHFMHIKENLPVSLLQIFIDFTLDYLINDGFCVNIFPFLKVNY